MLRDWRQTVSEEKERLMLRRALEEANLIRIADRYLPDGEYITNKNAWIQHHCMNFINTPKLYCKM